MKQLVIVLCVVGCSKGQEDRAVHAGAGSASAGSGSASPTDSAAAAPIDAAIAIAPSDAAAAVDYTCCCETNGDATHYTIEGDPSACTANDMRGSCVELKECGLDAPPRVLATGTALTFERGRLVAIWHTKEEKAYGGIELAPAGASVTVRTNASDDPVHWRKRGTIPAQPGPVTVTAEPDGTALVSNGKTTWVLAQEYRYGQITFTKRK